ncbi:MAG: ABC transporter ATP-binding protein/permease [Lachnospiraceae bacterium]|nr:ABC transporter ATP-binding protein/permease [Lachnospiraceae bacterium]
MFMNKRIIKEILKRIAKYRLCFVLIILSGAVSVAASLIIPVFTGNAIDHIIATGKVDFEALMPIIKKILIAALAAGAASWIMGGLNNRVAFNMVRDLRQEAFDKLSQLPLSYIDEHPAGEIINRIISDADTFGDGLLMGFTQLFTGVLTICCTLGFMFSVNIVISLVVVCITPLSILVAKKIASYTHDYFEKQSRVKAEQISLIEESITGLKVVKALGHEEEVAEDFDKINKELQGISLKALFLSSTVNPSTRFVNSLVYGGVGIVGALYAVNGGITVGVLSCFLSYASQYTKPFNEISGVITELQNAFVCAERLFDIINETPEQDLSATGNEITDFEAAGKIDIEHAAFGYSPDNILIKDLNLNVQKGMRVAIVGPTGCGKTTFINLLMRFYELNKGVIKVDDIDIKDISRKSLRSNIGMVLQDTWIKAGTVAENIAVSKPDATREEIIDAAKRAHAHSFIKRLPLGYDTPLSDDSNSLSQGQRQLLCIARVMLNVPPMVILDEATSNIDTRTELKIQQAFNELMEGRTSFVVAHRLSTIRESDIILVMKDGDIIETGNHEQLLRRKGFYYKLYMSAYA